MKRLNIKERTIEYRIERKIYSIYIDKLCELLLEDRDFTKVIEDNTTYWTEEVHGAPFAQYDVNWDDVFEAIFDENYEYYDSLMEIIYDESDLKIVLPSENGNDRKITIHLSEENGSFKVDEKGLHMYSHLLGSRVDLNGFYEYANHLMNSFTL